MSSDVITSQVTCPQYDPGGLVVFRLWRSTETWAAAGSAGSSSRPTATASCVTCSSRMSSPRDCEEPTSPATACTQVTVRARSPVARQMKTCKLPFSHRDERFVEDLNAPLALQASFAPACHATSVCGRWFSSFLWPGSCS